MLSEEIFFSLIISAFVFKLFLVKNCLFGSFMPWMTSKTTKNVFHFHLNGFFHSDSLKFKLAESANIWNDLKYILFIIFKSIEIKFSRKNRFHCAGVAYPTKWFKCTIFIWYFDVFLFSFHHLLVIQWIVCAIHHKSGQRQ